MFAEENVREFLGALTAAENDQCAQFGTYFHQAGESKISTYRGSGSYGYFGRCPPDCDEGCSRLPRARWCTAHGRAKWPTLLLFIRTPLFGYS